MTDANSLVDYQDSTATVTLTVKAIPVINWANPAAITYGAALSATQLNATSPVAGSFSYQPAAGSIPTTGSDSLTVTFTPTDSVDYATTTKTVILNVTQATPTIIWDTPAAITYGAALSASQLNASSPVAGTFSYTVAVGTIFPAGKHTLSAVFEPADPVNYKSVTAMVSLTVNQATPTITWTNPAAIPHGTPLSATQLDATAKVAGSFAYNPRSGTVLATGSHTLSTTFTPKDTVDYTTATARVTLIVH